MSDLSLALCLVIAHRLTAIGRHLGRSGHRRCTGDGGAVSLEQVLWFVAAGVSVAVVAGIIWNQIRAQAALPINAPAAP